MAVQIKIDQVTRPVGIPGKAREDLVLSQPVTLTATGGPFTEYLWSFIYKAIDIDAGVRSAALMSTPTAMSTAIAPIDIAGTYEVEVVVDSGSGLGANPDDVARITFYAGPSLNATPNQLPRRIPAYGETLEHNVDDVIEPSGNTEGWSREMLRWFALIRRIATSPSPGGGSSSELVFTNDPARSSTPRFYLDWTSLWAQADIIRPSVIRFEFNPSYAAPIIPSGDFNFANIDVGSFGIAPSVVLADGCILRRVKWIDGVQFQSDSATACIIPDTISYDMEGTPIEALVLRMTNGAKLFTTDAPLIRHEGGTDPFIMFLALDNFASIGGNNAPVISIAAGLMFACQASSAAQIATHAITADVPSSTKVTVDLVGMFSACGDQFPTLITKTKTISAEGIDTVVEGQVPTYSESVRDFVLMLPRDEYTLLAGNGLVTSTASFEQIGAAYVRPRNATSKMMFRIVANVSDPLASLEIFGDGDSVIGDTPVLSTSSTTPVEVEVNVAAVGPFATGSVMNLMARVLDVPGATANVYWALVSYGETP